MNKESLTAAEFIRKNIGRKLTAVNLFCGGGGVSAAIHNIGEINEVLAIDNWPIAEKVFTSAFSDVPFWLTDISALGEYDILRRTLLQKGELDLLVSTSPCPAFSPAKGYIDPLEEEAWLFINGLEQIANTMVKVAFFENVPGMTDDRATAIFNEIKCQTREKLEANYHIKSFILRACNYGVPQERDRFIWFFYRKDLGVIPTKPVEDFEKLKSLRIVDVAPEIDAIKVGQSRKTFKLNTRIMNTITASEGGIVVYSKGVKTKLSVEQLLRFATFPDWYKMPDGLSYSDAHEIIGNCVPVNFAQAIIEHIIREVGHKL